MKKYPISSKSLKNANSRKYSVKGEYITKGSEGDVFVFSGIIDGKQYIGEIPYSYIVEHALVYTPSTNTRFTKWTTYQTIKDSKKFLGNNPNYFLISDTYIKKYFVQKNAPKQLALF